MGKKRFILSDLKKRYLSRNVESFEHMDKKTFFKAKEKSFLSNLDKKRNFQNDREKRIFPRTKKHFFNAKKKKFFKVILAKTLFLI